MPLENRTVPVLVGEIAENVRGIFRGEIRLAVSEVKEEAAEAGRAAAVLGIGFVVGLYGLGVLLLTGIYALSMILQPWVAALIVAAVLGVVATLFVALGTKRLKKLHIKPVKTITSIKENAAWVKHQVK